MDKEPSEKITVIIIDNDPEYRKKLEKLVTRVNFFFLLGTFDNPLIALPLINEGKIDLIFSEIDMPGMDGVSFLKFLDNPPLTVFVTSSSHYAVDGFDLNVVDYIVKAALSSARFDRCLERIKKRYYSFESMSNSVMLRNGKKIHLLNPRNIYYIVARKDYIMVKTIGSEAMYMCTMKEAADRFSTHGFVQIHRSYIVNINHLVSVGPCSLGTWKARLKHINIDIPIGPNYRPKFFEMLNCL